MDAWIWSSSCTGVTLRPVLWGALADFVDHGLEFLLSGMQGCEGACEDRNDFPPHEP